jgi:hypothetical protein
MKKTTLTLLLFIGFLYVAKADTTDYFHIYFNDERIKMADEMHPAVLTYNGQKIQKTDSITVKPSKDAPCYTCATFLYVENVQGVLVQKAVGKGTFNPITFSLKDLVGDGGKPMDYRVFYSEEKANGKDGETPKVLISTIQIL